MKAKILLTAMIGVVVTVLLLIGSAVAKSASPTQSDEAKVAEAQAAAAAELQKATQNPVASLISVPIQNNSNFGVGPYDRTQDVLNIQPVIPANITKNWMLINRIIQPIVWQPYPNANTGGEYGLGDMNPTFFLSPRKPGKLIWGVGPAFVIPTATNDLLGQGKFSMGPSLVALTQPKPWTLGILFNNVWSVAGSGSRPDVNQMLLRVLHQLQPEKGLVSLGGPHHHGELESQQRQCLDGSFRRWSGSSHKTRLPAREYKRAVLRQSSASGRSIALGHAVADCIPVPKTLEATGEDDDGDEAEAVGEGTTAEEPK